MYIPAKPAPTITASKLLLALAPVGCLRSLILWMPALNEVWPAVEPTLSYHWRGSLKEREYERETHLGLSCPDSAGRVIGHIAGADRWGGGSGVLRGGGVGHDAHESGLLIIPKGMTATPP
jgi:hypothetical protein